MLEKRQRLAAADVSEAYDRLFQPKALLEFERRFVLCRVFVPRCCCSHPVVFVSFSSVFSSVRREEDGRKGGNLGDGEVWKEGAEESGEGDVGGRPTGMNQGRSFTSTIFNTAKYMFVIG